MTIAPRKTVNLLTLTRSALQASSALQAGSATLLSVAAITVLTVAGCATSVTGTKDSILPQNLKSMDQIYREHTQGKYRNPRAPVPASPETKGTTPQSATPPVRGNDARLRHASWDGYTRSAATEIDTLFPTLPNPMLVMHVFAHLSGTENTPVPGYATALPMYERVEFALPGELAYQHADVAGARQAPEAVPPAPTRPAEVVTTAALPGAAPPEYLMTTAGSPEAVTTRTDHSSP